MDVDAQAEVIATRLIARIDNKKGNFLRMFYTSIILLLFTLCFIFVLSYSIVFILFDAVNCIHFIALFHLLVIFYINALFLRIEYS